MDHSILDLLKRSAAIPSMPQVAARFLEIVQDPEFDYDEVVEVLSTDPGTASELLRLANSPLFGVTRKITSLTQALTLLGLKRVRSLVLGRYIVDSIEHKGTVSIDTSYYWRRSLTTAVLAAQFADPLEPQLREEAFISGLLADIGVVVLDEALPDQYHPIAERYRPHGSVDLSETEVQAIGVSHGQVSAMILEHWRLPDVVCLAVRDHALAPSTDGMPNKNKLAPIVGAADRIGKYLCETPNQIEQVIDFCRQSMASIGLEPSVLGKLLAEIEPQITDFASVLKVDVISSKVYALIAQKLQEELSTTAATA